MARLKSMSLATPRKMIEVPPSRAGHLTLVGGVLCLNFTNTTSGRGTDQRLEHLHRFEHLLAWARHAGALDDAAAKALEAHAPNGRVARRVLGRALALREALHALFGAVMAGTPAPVAALAELNRCLAEAMAAAAIERAEEGFAWRWPDRVSRPERLIWPLARSAAELLTAGDLVRIKACPGPGCGWLFLDTTRNGRRRWCEMEVCGSRAKMRRYHQRRRGSTGVGSAF
jgi:predicted RNA-binding Zn ribbon-like protein